MPKYLVTVMWQREYEAEDAAWAITQAEADFSFSSEAKSEEITPEEEGCERAESFPAVIDGQKSILLLDVSPV